MLVQFGTVCWLTFDGNLQLGERKKAPSSTLGVMKKTAGVCRVFMLEVNIVTESEGAVAKRFSLNSGLTSSCFGCFDKAFSNHCSSDIPTVLLQSGLL